VETVIPRLLAIALSVALLASACGSTTADNSSSESIQDALDALVAAGVPGAQMTIISDDGAKTLVAGVADVATGQAMVGDTKLVTGPLATSYLAALALALESDGELSLSQSVEEVLPGIVTNGSYITMYDLLQHNSGVPDYTRVGGGAGAVVEECRNLGDCNWDLDRMIELVAAEAPLYLARAGWSFSASNDVLTALILEELTDSSWTELLQKRLLTPLGLEDTMADWGQPINVAAGYYDLAGDGELQDMSALLPYGGGPSSLVSTSADVAEFFHRLLGGDVLGETQQQALKATVPTFLGDEEYGMGLSFPTGYQSGVVGNGGQTLGYASFVQHDPLTNETVALLVNTSGQLPDDEWQALIATATGMAGSDLTNERAAAPVQLRATCHIDPSAPLPSIPAPIEGGTETLDS
jgi:D-alanyl-D-alanine carboxypeptidase